MYEHKLHTRVSIVLLGLELSYQNWYFGSLTGRTTRLVWRVLEL